jgi:hypothetical protein
MTEQDQVFASDASGFATCAYSIKEQDPRIQLADEGLKICDTDNWSVDCETFKRLNKSFQFTIDLFATNKNSKCERFYSNGCLDAYLSEREIVM